MARTPGQEFSVELAHSPAPWGTLPAWGRLTVHTSTHTRPTCLGPTCGQRACAQPKAKPRAGPRTTAAAPGDPMLQEHGPAVLSGQPHPHRRGHSGPMTTRDSAKVSTEGTGQLGPHSDLTPLHRSSRGRVLLGWGSAGAGRSASEADLWEQGLSAYPPRGLPPGDPRTCQEPQSQPTPLPGAISSPCGEGSRRGQPPSRLATASPQALGIFPNELTDGHTASTASTHDHGTPSASYPTATSPARVAWGQRGSLRPTPQGPSSAAAHKAPRAQPPSSLTWDAPTPRTPGGHAPAAPTPEFSTTASR